MIATAQEFAPGVRIVVWDLGLRDEQGPKVSSMYRYRPKHNLREGKVMFSVTSVILFSRCPM